MNKLIIALVLLLGLFGAHAWDKERAVNVAITNTALTLNKEYQKQLDVAAKVARDKQDKMQELANKDRDEKDEQINAINNKLHVALVSLRNRPNRPASTPDNPKDSNVGQACTARELYREDAEFLTREAARADQVLAERNYYYSQYEKVRKQINGIDATN